MEMKTAEYEVIKGNSPFVISAPHVHTHKRPTLTGVFKLGEPYTDTICQSIGKETDSTRIFLVKSIEYDPNYFNVKKNPYKCEIVKIFKEGKRKKLFLDLHGLSDEYCYDIGIYYLSHFGKSKKIARELRNALDKGELKGMNIHIFRFLDDDQETLCEFVASKLKVPALQLEIARYIREDDILRNELINNISSFLNSF